MAQPKQQLLHDVSELCDDLVEHLDERVQAESIETAETASRPCARCASTSASASDPLPWRVIRSAAVGVDV